MSTQNLVQRPVDSHPLQLGSTLEESDEEADFQDRSGHTQHPNDNLVTGSSTITKSPGGPSIKSSNVPKNYDPLTAALEASGDSCEIPHSTSSNVQFKSCTVASYISQAPTTALMQREKFNPRGEILWSQVRSLILSKYTTSEGLTLRSSYLGGINTADPSHRPSLSNQVKQRLEQLDDFEDNQAREITNLTQSDYVRKIEQLNLALTHSWDTDQRVKALKIAIQCAKLLADVSVLRFYPSKFVLVTDILDNFGRLVDNRIIDKANQIGGEETARETCRNWFLKVASIRELIPRFYVELSILKTCGLLHVSPPDVNPRNHLLNYYFESLLRISKMVRGIGNPIVASYARCYICRVAHGLLDINYRTFSEIYMHNFTANADLLDRISRSNLCTFLFSQKMSLWDYYHILFPSFQWILQCNLMNSDDDQLRKITDALNQHVFDKSASSEQDFSKLFVLCSITQLFPPDFTVDNLDDLLVKIMTICSNQMNKKAQNLSQETPTISSSHHLSTIVTTPLAPIPSQLPFYVVIDNMGKALIGSKIYVSAATEAKKLEILNEVWKIIDKFSLLEYMTCARTWLKYSCRYLSTNEINLILGDIIQRVQPNRQFVNYYETLVGMISDMVANKECVDEFSKLFAMDNLSHLFDMIQKESYIIRACKITLESFLALVNSKKSQNDNSSLDLLELANRSQVCSTNNDFENNLYRLIYDDNGDSDGTITDLVIINQLTHLCKILHDSIGPFTFDDERRQMSYQIITFLRLVTFGIDLNGELDYLADCRASFDKLESVIYYLVHRSHLLAIKCRKLINRKRKKTPTFINSCLAYSFITIPTLSTFKFKANLLMEGTQVALLNSSISQADAFIKELLNLLSEYQNSDNLPGLDSAENMLDYTNNLLGMFIAYQDDIDLRCKSDLITLVKELDCSKDITLSKINSFLMIPEEEEP